LTDTIIMMNFGERLYSILKERGIKANELASRLNMDPSYLSRLRHGKRHPSRATLVAISKALGVPIDELLGLPSAPMPDGRMVPVISWVQAGRIREPQDPYNVGESGEEPPLAAYTTDPAAFALRVQGDSMEPEFVDGDIIVVSPSVDITSGDYCVFKSNGKAAFKQFKRYEDTVILRPLNSRYPDLVIQGDDPDKLEIIGKVVQKMKRY